MDTSKKKLRILHTIRQGKIGGGETHVLELTKNLDPERYDSVVLAFTDGEMIAALRQAGIPCYVIATDRAFDFSIWQKVKRLVTDLDIDIIHAHGTRACSNSFRTARGLNIPVIYTVHGWSFHPGLNRLVYKLRVRSEAFLTRRVARTINVGEDDQADGVHKFGLSNSVVIHNGIDLHKFDRDYDKQEIRGSLGIDTDTLVIGMVARLTYQKDPETFIAAAARVLQSEKNVCFLVVGDGELKISLEEQARKLNIQRQVIFTGYRTDIPQLLSVMDIYCLPSRWEGLPIGLLEAMASGLCVITTAVNGAKEIIKDGENGYIFNIGDSADLANKISSLLQDGNLRAKLSVEARKTVAEKFTIKKMVDRVSEQYDLLVPRQKKLKIGIEAQRLFRKEKHGLEIVALELIKKLQVTDLVNDYVIFVKEDADRDCIQETSNFKIRVLSSVPFPIWEQIKLPWAVKKEKIDLLHCTSNTAPMLCSVPTLLTLHDIIYLEETKFRGNYYQYLGNLYRKWLVPFIAKKCRKIITVSNFEKTRIVERIKADKARVVVVPNGINANFKELGPTVIEQARKKYALPGNFILFFGNSAPKKNTRNTILGYLRYSQRVEKPIPLVIAGAFKSYVARLLNSINVSSADRKNIVIINYIPFNDQPLIYNAADLFLYTSRRESFGMPILESMACGTPVITSNISSMPEIAGEAAVCVNPEDPSDISQAIYDLMSCENERKRLVSSGLKRAGKFSWQQTADQVLSIYHACLARVRYS